MIKLSIFLLLAAIVYSRAERADPNEIERSCLRLNGIENQNRFSLMSRLMRHDEMSYEEKCFFKCFNQRAHMMDDDANFTPREGITFVAAQANGAIPESHIDIIVSAMQDCGFSHVVDHCERAAKISNCFYGHLQNLI